MADLRSQIEDVRYALKLVVGRGDPISNRQAKAYRHSEISNLRSEIGDLRFPSQRFLLRQSRYTDSRRSAGIQSLKWKVRDTRVHNEQPARTMINGTTDSQTYDMVSISGAFFRITITAPTISA